jgi:hypothetical protein
LGPWMVSSEADNGTVNVALAYTMRETARRAGCAMGDGLVRTVVVDARGQMIFGMERRSNDWVGTKEIMDMMLTLIESTGDFDGAIAAMSMSDAIKMSAQRKGLA